MDWLALSKDGHRRARLTPAGEMEWLVPWVRVATISDQHEVNRGCVFKNDPAPQAESTIR